MPNEIISLCHYDLKAPDGTLLKKHLHLEIHHDEILLVTGSNGSGKTTLVHALSHMLRKEKLKVELLPQLMSLKSSLPLSLFDVLNISIDDLSLQKILEIGLLEKRQLDLSWNTSSGGEKRRTLLTRSLLLAPDVLILDEPFNHLDASSVDAISLGLSKQIKDKKIKAMVVVSHPIYLKHPSFNGVGLREVRL